MLCQVVPNPPPGVNTNLPEPSTADAARAKRERMVEHAQNPACSGCHRLMDPIGFGLEKYDAVGAWRDQETRGHLRRRGRGAPEQAGRMSTSTPTGEIARTSRIRRSPIRAPSAACWRRARSARIVSSSRCSATRSGGPKHRPIGSRSQPRRRRFGAPGSSSKKC